MTRNWDSRGRGLGICLATYRASIIDVRDPKTGAWNTEIVVYARTQVEAESKTEKHIKSKHFIHTFGQHGRVERVWFVHK